MGRNDIEGNCIGGNRTANGRINKEMEAGYTGRGDIYWNSGNVGYNG
jgi:hypothetical protein